jgi:hypothetical protein
MESLLMLTCARGTATYMPFYNMIGRPDSKMCNEYRRRLHLNQKNAQKRPGLSRVGLGITPAEEVAAIKRALANGLGINPEQITFTVRM